MMRPSRRVRRQGDADEAADHPGQLQRGVAAGEGAGAHPFGHVALDRRVQRQLGQALRQPGHEAEHHQGEQPVDQGGEDRRGGAGQHRQHDRELRVHPLHQRPDGDAEEVAEAGRADDRGEQELRRVAGDRVDAQQERHEEREEAREPARAAVRPERERHRRRGCAPCRGPARRSATSGVSPDRKPMSSSPCVESTRLREPDREDRGDDEDHERVAQGPLRPDRRRPDGERRGDRRRRPSRPWTSGRWR